jgi:Fe-S cluster assembly protein SufD
MTTATGNPYAAAFEQLPGAGPAWLGAMRSTAMQRFAQLGFPTTKDEEWRFTNVAPIARTAFRAAEPARVSAGDVEGLLYPAAGTRLVFVNGRFARELSTLAGLPEGVKAGSLRAALEEDPETLRAHLGQHAQFSSHAFTALNTALTEDGAYLRIPRGVVVEQPIEFVFAGAGGAEEYVTHPRNLITIGPNAQATLVESYVGLAGAPCFTNAVTELVAGEGAVVDHYKLQLERRDAFHVATFHAALGRSANLSSHSIALGGGLVRNDANAVLSEGCECTMNGLYVVNGRQHVDNHTAIDHAKPHAASHELYKGILDGHATAVFNGKIYVRKDAQKTDAKQTNKNLVLSEDAVINTKPELQIWADDVRCTHGATIGQLDSEAIFYLQSRGIGREQARDMLTYAFARDIVERIRVEALRDRLEHLLYERLHERGD